MLNLKSLFKNHFHSSRITDDRLKMFMQDHIQRIVVNNKNGKYDAMLSETIAVYNGYSAAITDKDTQLAVRKSKTKMVNAIFLKFKKTVQQKEGMIRGIFGVKTAVYKEFFPRGVKQYWHCNKSNADVLMVRLVRTSGRYAAELGNGLVQLFTELKDEYINARKLQLQRIGMVSASRTKTKLLRAEVEKRLCKNALLLAAEFLEKPRMVNVFFSQKLLRKRKRKKKKAGGVK